MIPPFESSGWLPPGVYSATIDEIEQRFGRQSELRRVQMESVRWMLDLARRAGVQRVVLNGSFVTDIMEPNDVDCVLLVASSPSPDPSAEAELVQGLPFLDIALVAQADFDYLVTEFFAVDRSQRAKGVVEVIL